VVVVDTSPNKTKVMAWAKELLPADDRYFAALSPSMNPAYLMQPGSGPDSAHADLFANSLMLISTQPGIDDSAIELVSNLVTILGASPLFADTTEADGLAAYSHMLPRLASVALVNATIDQPGWREARKMPSHAYAMATEPVMHLDENLTPGLSAMNNAENVVRMLDALMVELRDIRDALAENDTETLQNRITHAREGRELWWQQRVSADWEPKSNVRMPTGGEMIGRLFGMKPKTDPNPKKR
jgi:prephenate dehydrogenase